MKYKVFTIKDKGVDAFLKPFFMSHKNEAIRAISDLLLDPEHNFTKHATDYSLWEIGTFDDETAIMEPIKDHVCLHQLDEIKTILIKDNQ